MLIETSSRSLLKAVSYRTAGTALTLAVTFFVTRRLSLSIGVAALDGLSKLFIFFLHERAWNRISFGRAKKGKDYEI